MATKDTTLSNIKKNKIQSINEELSALSIEHLNYPSYVDIFDELNFTDVMENIQIIIKKYDDNLSKQYENVHQDVVKLGSLMVKLSIIVGKAQGFATYGDQNQKMYINSVGSASMKIASDKGLNLTAADTATLAKANSKLVTEKSINYNMASSIITNYYFACKQFLDILISLSSRKNNVWG